MSLPDVVGADVSIGDFANICSLHRDGTLNLYRQDGTHGPVLSVRWTAGKATASPATDAQLSRAVLALWRGHLYAPASVPAVVESVLSVAASEGMPVMVMCDAYELVVWYAWDGGNMRCTEPPGWFFL